ncbi:MAG: hypothetical protein AB7N71_11320 [Phycisphaerae bacterium]
MKIRTFVLSTCVATLSLGAACPMAGGFVNDPTATEVSFGENTPSQFREGMSTAGSEFDSTCQGFFPATAQHILNIDASQALEVQISGDDGVRVLLLAGQSKFCSSPDDSLVRFFTRGELMVFVGADEVGKTVSYRIDFVKQ